MAFRRRNTKIVATLGPSCSDRATQRALIEAGVDVARLNASHGDKAFFTEMVTSFREVAAELGREVSILLDLRGPKIRVGEMPEDGVELVSGESLVLTTTGGMGDATRVPCTYAGLPGDVEAGDRLLLDDGLLSLRVEEILSEEEIRCVVVDGGRLKSNKGINVPGRPLSTPALSAKDLTDLETGIELGVDWIALSFVRHAADVVQLRDEMHKRDGVIPIVAKIEKPQAVDAIEDILQASDGIMVARGDLGVEVEPERVPNLQKSLIHAANEYGIPVITATQMLESMIQNPRPTRAEASDVANAIFDGTDAVMLSGETAAGKYPVEAVRMMNSIAEEAERSRFYRDDHDPLLSKWSAPAIAMSKAAKFVARTTDSQAIVVYTQSGRSARILSKLGPGRRIVAMSPDPIVCRQLALFHGITPMQSEYHQDTDTMLKEGDRQLIESGIVRKGDAVVVMGGRRQFQGAINMLQLRRIGEDG